MFTFESTNKNDMKNQLEILIALSKVINLDLFYVVNFWNDEIKLQGHKTSRIEVNKSFKTPFKLSENGWFESEHEFEESKIKIVLT